MMIIILFNSMNASADNSGKLYKYSGTISSAAMYDANRVIKDEEKQGLPSARQT